MKRPHTHHDTTKRLIAEAQALGWAVQRTRGGHLKFVRPGYRTRFFSSTPSDHRAWRNALADLRRATRGHQETENPA